jgi:hypothetical protein
MAEAEPSVESLAAFIQAYEGGVYAIIVSVVRLRAPDAAPAAGLTDVEIARAVHGTAFTDAATCSICLASHTRRAARLQCGHCYHRPCIETWLRRADTCPLCREQARC